MAKVNPFMFSTKFYDWETGLYYYGHRYYNPSTGRWLSRDPAEEDGSFNLYAILSNDPVDDVDYLGLVDYKFEVLTGNPFSPGSIRGGIGTWGQPWWCADGLSLILGNRAYSSVTVTSREGGNACNSILAPDPAGTIYLYLRNPCPGDFQVMINATVQLTATGPLGNAMGNLQDANRQYLIKGTVSSHSKKTGSSFSVSDIFEFTAHVGTSWTLAAQYTPVIGLDPSKVKSTGSAYGAIEYDGAIPK
jgi:RHS repeat-associated protein